MEEKTRFPSFANAGNGAFVKTSHRRPLNSSIVRRFDAFSPSSHSSSRPRSSISGKASLVSTFFCVRPSVCFLKSCNGISGKKKKKPTTTSSTCRPLLSWLRQLPHIWLNASRQHPRRATDLPRQPPAEAQPPLKKNDNDGNGFPTVDQVYFLLID